MSRINQQRKTEKEQTARMLIVSELWLHGYTFHQIKKEVMKRTGRKTYSLDTVKKDVDKCKERFQASILNNVAEGVALELARIDDTVRELWSQWEKSKQDGIITTNSRRGAPKGTAQGTTGDNGEIQTLSVEEKKQQVVGLGNVSYIAEIRAQLVERRKLLGLYAPEKVEKTGKVKIDANLAEMPTEEIEAKLKRAIKSITEN